MDFDYRIKANSPIDRDPNVDTWKIPAAGDQPTVEGSRILGVHFEQQLQLVLDGEFASDLVSSEAAHADTMGRIECPPAHVNHRELLEERRGVQWHECE